MSLTDLSIKNLKPREKSYRVKDSGNLSLEVSPSGSKLWRWRYYFLGKSQILALGKYPTISLSQARKLRDDARQLVKEGKHPTREQNNKKLKQVHDGLETFEKIAREWFKQRSLELDKRYSKQYLKRMEKFIFPSIGSLPLKEITIPDVVRMVDSIPKKGKRIETANRMKQATAQIFRFAAVRGLCEQNPAADLKDILPSRKTKHHACINPTELSKLLSAIAAYNQNKLTSYALKLIALTLLRTKELIMGEWSEIDWKKKEWKLSPERMKMDRPHIVPLSKPAIKLLKELHQITGTKRYIFFSSASKTGHLSNGAILMALRRMGYEKTMTGHGFRTLASTILNEKGYSKNAIEKQLAHEEEDKVRAAYNRAEYLSERKQMMSDYAKILSPMLK